MTTARQELGRAIRLEAKRELQRRDLLEFVTRRVPGYLPGRFHRVICDRLMEFSAQVARGESPRLIIAAPPRHGKTEIVSKHWPVWHLGHHGHHEIITASYAQDLANKNSRAARGIASEAIDLWPEVLPGEPATVQEWGIKGGGQYKAVGVGAGITGQGGHIAIIDDPVKDWQEALSQNRREAVWAWYRSTLYTRLAPGGGMLVMATRWHHDDLTGRLLNEMKTGDGDVWDVLEFPAEAWEDAPEYDWREPGEALHPDRFPSDRLQVIRRAVGSRVYGALYDQRPTPDAGSTFKREWFKTHDLDPWRTNWDEALISVDATFKGGATSDFVVMQAWGRLGAGMYLLAQVRDRLNFPETVHALVQFRARHHYVSAILVEEKANGAAIISTLEREVPGLIAIVPKESKEARASSAAVAYEAGNVFHPRAKWVDDSLEPEMLSFPAGANDDQVDTATQAINRWLSEGGDPAERMRSAFAGLFG